MKVITGRPVTIQVDGGELIGDLMVPRVPRGLVVFAHGSGSSRLSPRNRRVASILNDAGFATLLVDLLTPQEEVDDRTAHLRFDIDLLTRRVGAVTGWVRQDDEVRRLPLGLFGASTGAAAALAAAALETGSVSAVVSRGGRPDLAGALLTHVQAPTLLVVGSRDPEVLQLNQDAARRLLCEHRIVLVPGATHLFDEPGTLDQAAQLAVSWFDRHLAQGRNRSRQPERDDQHKVTSGPYADRTAAGEMLARALSVGAEDLHDPLVVGLPRGGVEVAVVVARALDAPIEVVVARKMGVPSQPELALGAVDEDGVATIDRQLQRDLHLSIGTVEDLARTALAEAVQRADALRDGRPVTEVDGRDVILVDDGYATGMTARVAAAYLKRHGARSVILAVPVAPRSLVGKPPKEFDRVVCPYLPAHFRAVSMHYGNFDEVTDVDVRRLLREHARTSGTPAATSGSTP